jgi:hypothetical protein
MSTDTTTRTMIVIISIVENRRRTFVLGAAGLVRDAVFFSLFKCDGDSVVISLTKSSVKNYQDNAKTHMCCVRVGSSDDTWIDRAVRAVHSAVTGFCAFQY